MALFVVCFAAILHFSWPQEREKITIVSYNNSWKLGPESNKFEIENGLFSLKPLLTYSYEGYTYTTHENVRMLPIEPKRIEDKRILFEEATNKSNNYQKIYRKDSSVNAIYVAIINGVPYYTIENVYLEKNDNYNIACKEISKNETEINFQVNKSNVILNAFLWSLIVLYLIFYSYTIFKKNNNNKD